MKKTALILFLSIIAACTVSHAAESETARPNIIYILADDLGWTDTGTYGSRYYETPNIDKLASQGMKFTQYHNCPNCQPTRASLLTGQYGPRTGIYTVGDINRFNWKSRTFRPAENLNKLPLEKITFAQQIKKAGYATAMFGKWHLGEDTAHHPSKRGFDEAIVSDGVHFNFHTNPKTPYQKKEYLADFLTDRAVDFIRRKKDDPFFLYLPHFGVHVPLQSREDDKNHFAAKAPEGGHNNPTYAGMIYAVDRSVGRIMALLEELKIADHTVIIFSSDNGGVGGYGRADGMIRDPGQEKHPKVREKGDIGQFDDITDNAPLRSGKGSLYEGGTRDPLIVRWPGIVKAGTTCDAPTIHVDIFPTFLEIAAAPLPDQVLDGESLVACFKNPATPLKRSAIYQHFPGYLGSGPGLWRTTPVGTIQVGDWKLMEYFEDNHLELYNLKDDIGEKHNLAEQMPDKAKELLEMMRKWRTEIKAPMPTPNKPSAGKKH